VNKILSYVIEMVIAIYFIGYLLPAPLTNLMNSTLWGTTVVASPVWSIISVLLPMLIIVGLGLALMPQEIKSKVGL
jgi:hypothetical protein